MSKEREAELKEFYPETKPLKDKEGLPEPPVVNPAFQLRQELRNLVGSLKTRPCTFMEDPEIRAEIKKLRLAAFDEAASLDSKGLSEDEVAKLREVLEGRIDRSGSTKAMQDSLEDDMINDFANMEGEQNRMRKVEQRRAEMKEDYPSLAHVEVEVTATEMLDGGPGCNPG